MDYGALATLNGYMNNFFAQTLCSAKKIRHISNGWCGMPYWNIWLQMQDGAYKMELASLDTPDVDEWIATFNVKYYPARHEPCFSELSVYEQECRNSKMFIGSPSFAECECCSSPGKNYTSEYLLKEIGVPSLQFYDLIPQDFFFTGGIKIQYSKSRGSKLMMKAPERWRVLITSDACLKNNVNFKSSVENECIDRNYPGYELTLILYKQIENNWGQFHKYQKIREQRRRESGFEFVYDGQTLCKLLSNNISVRNICTIFN